MPRTAREKSKSGIYHVMLRGINRQTIFEDSEDCQRFLDTMQECKEKSDYKMYAYCLMRNHIHLLIKEEEEDLGIVMRRIGASFVYWYNSKYERCGHLFQGRYRSEAVEDERYFLTVLRYIHQNPLKAGRVKDIASYKWSSYNEFMDLGGEVAESKIIDSDFVLDMFGEDRRKAVISFKNFHETAETHNCLDIDDRARILDNRAEDIIKKICNIEDCMHLKDLESSQRDGCIKMLKENGLSLRQIERLTGISRGVLASK